MSRGKLQGMQLTR